VGNYLRKTQKRGGGGEEKNSVRGQTQHHVEERQDNGKSLKRKRRGLSPEAVGAGK